MKKTTFFALCFVTALHSCLFAQKNKFENILNTRKLGVAIKKVKESDKDDYYQQYYRLSLVEELQELPHLKEIKPVVLYQFVKEITPPIPAKKLSKEQKKMRHEAQLSLDQYLSKKDWTNPIKSLNLLTYVDPENQYYHTRVDPEKITVLMPKKLFAFGTENTETREQKYNYLWADEDNKYSIVNIIPPADKTNSTFYEELQSILPDYQFPDMPPVEVKMGDKKLKSDANFYYIKPFQVGNNNIVYKTEDFKKFTLVRYMKDGGPWTDYEHRPRKW